MPDEVGGCAEAAAAVAVDSCSCEEAPLTALRRLPLEEAHLFTAADVKRRQDLYYGKAVDIDLTATGACFKFLRAHQVASVRVVRRIRVDCEAKDMTLSK